MSSYHEIYRNHPQSYDELVRAEDADGLLRETLSRQYAFSGARVVEAGAGTGRLTELALVAGAARVVATEIEPAMLSVAEERLANYSDRTEFVVADARELPLPAESADIAMAGWVFGHFRAWMPQTWRGEMGRAIDHLERVTVPGGRVVIVETLGTGTEVPNPSDELAEYYEWLEGTRGYERTEIRTDYVFASVADAARVTGAFFGAEFGERVREHRWSRVPECTGVWITAV